MMYSRYLVQSCTKSSFYFGSSQLWWLHIIEESFSLNLNHLSICSEFFRCRIFHLVICWNLKTVFCAFWQVWNAKIKSVVEWSFTWFPVKSKNSAAFMSKGTYDVEWFVDSVRLRQFKGSCRPSDSNGLAWFISFLCFTNAASTLDIRTGCYTQLFSLIYKRCENDPV